VSAARKPSSRTGLPCHKFAAGQHHPESDGPRTGPVKPKWRVSRCAGILIFLLPGSCVRSGSRGFYLGEDMRKITLCLPDALYEELETAAAGARELGFGPERWAQEVLESELATRRLPKNSLRLTAEDSYQRKPQALDSFD
jgi:hypothetical protein